MKMKVSIFLIGLAFVINIIKFKRNIKGNAPGPFLGAIERLPYFSAAADFWPNTHWAERAFFAMIHKLILALLWRKELTCPFTRQFITTAGCIDYHLFKFIDYYFFLFIALPFFRGA
jgi:hypothetical protein